MSRSGLLGPIVSSRSSGPEPATSTTPGNGPSPTGIESVPGNVQGALPTVTSVSLKDAGSTYDAGGGDGATEPAGDAGGPGDPRWKPATAPA